MTLFPLIVIVPNIVTMPHSYSHYCTCTKAVSNISRINCQKRLPVEMWGVPRWNLVMNVFSIFEECPISRRYAKWASNTSVEHRAFSEFFKNFYEILLTALWLQAAEWRRAEKNRLIVIQLDGRRVIADHFIISQLNIKKIVQ